MNIKSIYLSILSLVLTLLFSSSALSQGVATSTYGVGGKVGFSKELGGLVGGELYYKTGSWQFELYSTSSAVNLHHTFSKQIEQADVFAGATVQGELTKMATTTSHTGLNVRWFFSGSMNLGFGYAQYQVDVDYEILSDDGSETYANIATAQTNAMTVSFGNQWKLFGFAYLGLDWISSFQPTLVELEGVTQSNTDAPTDAGNVITNDKVLQKTSDLSGSNADFFTMSIGVEF
jgi:hypothetical protein